MTVLHERRTPMSGGVGAGVGFVGAIVATIVAVSIGATRHAAWALVLLAVVAAVVSMFSSWAAGLFAAVMCWAFDSGFVLGREAHLVFTPSSAAVALVLGATAITAGALAHAHRALIGRARLDAEYSPVVNGSRVQRSAPARSGAPDT